MSITERYLAYATAFEETFEDDDWSRIEPYFTEDAVYEGESEARGRDAVMAKLRTGIDTFDRNMDSRAPDFEPPTVKGNTLTMNWTVTYAKAGCPDLVLQGVEAAVFEGDRIASLRDDIEPGTMAAMNDWMTAHGARLQGSK